MESGAIRHSQLASSGAQLYGPAHQGRLFSTHSTHYNPHVAIGRYPYTTTNIPPLVIHLREFHMITGVVTQGSGLGTEWLKQVKVATSVGPLRTDLVYITTSSVQVSSTENEPVGI